MRKPFAQEEITWIEAPNEQKCFATGMISSGEGTNGAAALEPAPLAPLALPVLLLLLPLGVLRPPQNVHALHRQKEQSKALSKPEHHPSHNSVVVSPGFGDVHASLVAAMQMTSNTRFISQTISHTRRKGYRVWDRCTRRGRASATVLQSTVCDATPDAHGGHDGGRDSQKLCNDFLLGKETLSCFFANANDVKAAGYPYHNQTA